MDLLFGLALLALASLPIAYAIYRSNELFRLRVRGGKVELVRGRVPPALLSDVQDIFSRTAVSAHIRVVVENRTPRAIVQGVDADLAQRVRNVVGRFRLAAIRSGSRTARR